MKRTLWTIIAGILLWSLLWTMAGTGTGVTEDDFRAFVKEYEAKVIPLSKESGLASFNASISGKDEDYEKSSELWLKYRKLHSDPVMFARIEAFRDGGEITDPVLKRELQILYLNTVGNQIDTALLAQITEMETSIEQRFNTFRVKVGDRTMSDNEVDSILRASTDSAELEAVWKASKEIGKVVEADVRKLTKLRNQAARSVGFKNFYDMQLTLSEIDPAELTALFKELDELTHDSYIELKAEMDSALAARLGISVTELRPWHYQNRFAQEAPSIYGVDLSSFYEGKDPVAIATKYFTGIGMSVDSILAHSDLYEKPGKYQHAYSTDIDRHGDSRIVCSIRPNYYWMGTLLHELGHSVYSIYYDPALPWLLRQEAHSFATEAVAQFFGALPANPAWLVSVVGANEDDVTKVSEACARSLRAENLIFSRWSQVVVNFERALSADPDQDLNTLWWDLVEKYQMIPRLPGRNEPDWASKIHIASYPADYHSYLMGLLLTAQFTDALEREVLYTSNTDTIDFANDPRIGEYFIDKVFNPGGLYLWNEMVERSTGSKLSSAAFARALEER